MPRLGGDDHRAGEEHDLAEVDDAVLVEAGGLLPPFDRLGGGRRPAVARAEAPGGGVAEGDEVLLQLLDVGATGVGPERPPGGPVPEEQRHLVPVDLVERLTPVDGGAQIRILCQKRRPVQIADVHQGRELGRGGDPNGGLDHTPHHHHQVVRSGDGDHPQGLPQAPGLGQLDVDPVHGAGQPGNVG